MTDLHLIDITEVCRRAGISKTTIWRKLKAGAFPRPVYLSEQCRRWKAHELDAWIASLPISSSSPTAPPRA